MSKLKKDYVIQEVLDCVARKQVNNEEMPDLSSDKIWIIADSILVEWNELGDPEADFSDMVEWNLENYIGHNA